MAEERPDRSFLARWARLKREAAKEPELAPEPAAPQPPDHAEAAARKAAELEERLAALPKLEEIGAGTDIAVFLQDWVPHAIRNAALRKVWSSDPRITDFKEVADYQLDWNTPGGAPGYGPLEPDFDTEAAVRRIFRETAPDREEPCDRLSQAADASAKTAGDHAAPQQELALEIPDMTMGNYTKVVGEDANASNAAAEGGDALQHDPPPAEEEPRARRPRHGGALPGKRG